MKCVHWFVGQSQQKNITGMFSCLYTSKLKTWKFLDFKGGCHFLLFVSPCLFFSDLWVTMIWMRYAPISMCSHLEIYIWYTLLSLQLKGKFGWFWHDQFVLNHTQHPADNFREYKINDSGYSCLQDVGIALRNIAFKRYLTHITWISNKSDEYFIRTHSFVSISLLTMGHNQYFQNWWL